MCDVLKDGSGTKSFNVSNVHYVETKNLGVHVKDIGNLILYLKERGVGVF